MKNENESEWESDGIRKAVERSSRFAATVVYEPSKESNGSICPLGVMRIQYNTINRCAFRVDLLPCLDVYPDLFLFEVILKAKSCTSTAAKPFAPYQIQIWKISLNLLKTRFSRQEYHSSGPKSGFCKHYVLLLSAPKSS